MKTTLALTFSLLFALTTSAQDWAKARLDKSPRHQEWVKVKHDKREVDCFIVYPEVKDKATAVALSPKISWMSTTAVAFSFTSGYTMKQSTSRLSCFTLTHSW